MNFLDKAIGYFSPKTALDRARARMALDQSDRILRSEKFRYDGATAGRRAYGWYAASSDANVELMGALVWLRNRSRDLVRNNPYASKAIEELVANTVGTGIVPQAKTGDERVDRIIDNEWMYFVEQCDTPQRLDFYGMQALVMRSTAESGEEIVRFRPRLTQDNLRVPLQLQILEADFLDQSRTMGLINGHVMQGVQFDLLGRRTAYWLFSYHPGGVLILNPRGGIISQPVPADQIMHVYRVLRPGQVRGVPWLGPVMMALRDLDDYSDAERVRKKIEACLAAFVTQPEGTGGPLMGQPGTDPNNNLPVETFEPGMVAYMKPGQTVTVADPKGVGGYREYKMTELQGIAAGVGIPYELMSGDMSQVNFSSWRGGMLGFRNIIEGYRWLTLIPQFCMPVRRRFIDTLVLQGKIKSQAETPGLNLYSTQWTAPRFESVDPVKDAESVLKDVRMGRLTWFEAVIQNGYDPRTQLEQIRLFNKLVDRFEIILDVDPRNTTLRGQEQPAGTEERTPSSKPDNKGSGSEGLAALTEEDFRAIKQLVIAGHDRLRSWDRPSRTYLT